MHAKNKTNPSPQKSQHRDYGGIIDCAELQQVIVEVLLLLFSYCWMSKVAPGTSKIFFWSLSRAHSEWNINELVN